MFDSKSVDPPQYPAQTVPIYPAQPEISPNHGGPPPSKLIEQPQKNCH